MWYFLCNLQKQYINQVMSSLCFANKQVAHLVKTERENKQPVAKDVNGQLCIAIRIAEYHIHEPNQDTNIYAIAALIGKAAIPKPGHYHVSRNSKTIAKIAQLSLFVLNLYH